MPRIPRPVVPGQPLHLIQRGNNRVAAFIDDQDFEQYLRVLREASRKTECAVHAYVLMSNHVHLLATANDARGPSRLMQGIGTRYVRYFNERHGRTGTLWEGRYRSTLVDSERYFFTCMGYIELNPVRAGVVSTPRAYRWSSWRGNVLGERDPVITPHPLYRALGVDAAERRVAYARMFNVPLDAHVVEAIRRAAKTGAVLGTAACRLRLESTLKRTLARLPHGGARRGPAFDSTRVGVDFPSP
jgi:putative transposase